MSPAADAILRPGPRRRLTEDEILDAALDLLAEGGLDALSIRSVCSRLHASPGSFYTYFDNKDSLLESVMARAFGRVGRSELTGVWRDDLATILQEVHQAFRSHPATITLLDEGVGSHRLDPARERLLLLLEQAGLTLHQRIGMQDSLVGTAVGHVVVEHGHSRGAGRTEELRRRRALSPAEFPHLVQAAVEGAPVDHAAEFTVVLEALLDAIEAIGNAQA